MVKTVEDPNRHVNRQIAHWIRDRDLVAARRQHLRGRCARITAPLLCVSARGDGIVPRETAEFPYHARELAREAAARGRAPAELAMAHADLFISNEAQARVFEPIAAWLARAGVEALAPRQARHYG